MPIPSIIGAPVSRMRRKSEDFDGEMFVLGYLINNDELQ